MSIRAVILGVFGQVMYMKQVLKVFGLAKNIESCEEKDISLPAGDVRFLFLWMITTLILHLVSEKQRTSKCPIKTYN